VRTDTRATARRTLVVIGLTLATAAVLLLAYQTRRVLVWIGVAVFLAVALDPVVSWLERRAGWMRRSLATLLVFLAALVVLAAVIAALVLPLAGQGAKLADRFPEIVQQVRAGRGPVGGLLARTHVLDYLSRHEAQIRASAGRLVAPATTILAGAATVLAGAVTALVLSFLMVVQAPRLKAAILGLFDPPQAERVRRVGARCAQAVTGYISGNLLISVIAGTLTWLALALLRVPYSGLLALVVAILDVIPLVGATLGAVIACGAAFVHSPTAGIVMVVFFVVYQQFENHVLQPLIMSRAVRLNPLTVLIAVLIAAELAGVLGALVAMPVAAILQTIVRELWSGRRRRPATERPQGPPENRGDPLTGPA
jgi:predicted PurR-regulated permease PerM